MDTALDSWWLLPGFSENIPSGPPPALPCQTIPDQISSNSEQIGQKRPYSHIEDGVHDVLVARRHELKGVMLENERLKAENDALTRFKAQACYLEDILTHAAVSTTLIPSRIMGGNPAEETANRCMQVAWRGDQPPDEWCNAWADLSLHQVASLDTAFKESLYNAVDAWKRAMPSGRRNIEAIISNALRERCKIITVLATKSPRTLIEYWAKASVPSDTQHVHQHLTQLVDKLDLMPQQRILITEIWKRYCESMNKVNARIQAARIALTSASKFTIPPDEVAQSCTSTRVVMASQLETYNDDLNSAVYLGVGVRGRLTKAMIYTLTWRQCSALILGMKRFGLTNAPEICKHVASMELTPMPC